MTGLFADIADYCRVQVPEADRLPIAMVGAGEIVDVAHLPAYRNAGLDVVGIFDIDLERAHRLAALHGVETVYTTLDDVLNDDTVQVVDVAVTAGAQPEIVRRALESHRHVLAQKPFAPSVEVAQSLVELSEARGLVLAVNQQLRYDEGISAAHRMVELGWVGPVTCMWFGVNIWTEWATWPWMLEAPELEILNHSIHYHDVLRWFLGDPEVLFSVGGRTPGQVPVGETRTVTTCSYPSGAVSLVHANHQNAWGDNTAAFRIDGAAGSIRGTLGLLYDYPRGRPDTLEVNSSVLGTDGWLAYPVTHRWIPDAFAGPMASLLATVATGAPSRSSARDNLGTLRVVRSIYASMETGSAQRPGSASVK